MEVIDNISKKYDIDTRIGLCDNVLSYLIDSYSIEIMNIEYKIARIKYIKKILEDEINELDNIKSINLCKLCVHKLNLLIKNVKLIIKISKLIRKKNNLWFENYKKIYKNNSYYKNIILIIY